LDTQDQLAMVKRIMRGMNLDEELYPPRQGLWFIAGNKDEGRRARDVEPYDDFSERMVSVYAAYDAQCQREGAVDFAELLLRSYELLANNETLREHYRSRFKHILVDEFQDTNKLQYRWLQLLAGQENSVFAVGDDDQSIYAFRGANTANMQHLQRDFHVERVIKLEQNYRSHAHILDAANALIAHNRKRLGKNLWTSEGKGEPLRVYEASTDLEEASYIVQEVRGLKSEGVSLGEIGLLYRSNAQSRVLEHALFNASLPYRVYGGLRFFERQEIKHALAYLRLVANADDDGAFLRIVNFPTRGIGARSIEQIEEVSRTRGMTMWAAACANTLSGKASTSIAGFVRLIENMREATAGLPLPEVIDHVIAASGLKLHYQSEKEGADRLENLAELVTAAASFITERDVQPLDEGVEEPDELTAFLAHAALESGEHQALAGAEALQLMTVHSSKGLEFHTVFISGMEEGLFPHENSAKEDEGLEEERRLMYVALTRARRRLYLTYAQSRMLHGQTRFNVASRFFQEIPAQLMRKTKAVSRPLQPSYFAGRGYAGNVAVQPKVDMGNIDSGLPWRIGQSVVHAKFGPGVIVTAEGRGADARVQVNFRDSGMKWLMLEYANLAPA
ncbi:MAG TPA: 3'-5' exonuclease, partial [Burkholderiales bacterium]|nr:3'-5' exonuclease [Burkholderiales bacterium]